MTQASGAPLTDDAVFNQSNGNTPRPVEDLVAESQAAASAPSLDPQPSAPPPAPTPPAPSPQPVPEPEVVPAEPAPAADPAPSTDLALPTNVELEQWTNDEPWDHEKIEFRGDLLNVRKPTDQALAGLSLSSSKYVKMTTRNDITGLFIARHLSPQSYDRVFSRLMDPDDPNYTVETIGELMGAIVGNRSDAAQ